MAMVLRALSIFSAGCLLLLAATPQVGDAQPPREKSIWNYDGGVQLVTDGAIANGPCFRLAGRLRAPQFFDNLRRVDTSTGTLFRRGNEIVTEFPERMELGFELYDMPCTDKLEQAGTTRTYLNKAILRTLHVNFFWKRGLSIRPAPEIVLKHAQMIPIEPFAQGLSSEPLPVKYEWWFQFDVPSAGIPLTDSLVLVILSPEGKIVARCAARL
jgi:hypothetical protein